jgi:hypothetical protein
LAPRLFTTPPRWGWRAAEVAVPKPSVPLPGADLAVAPRPAWLEPPRPDTSALRQARSSAVTKLVWRMAFSVLLVVAFVAFQAQIEEALDELDLDSSAYQVYQVAVLIGLAVLAIGIVRGFAAVGSASRAISRFEQPYRTMVANERQRHAQAVAEWEAAVRQHRDAAARLERQRATGPLWYPVYPAREPSRVDVCGGDPHRHGWASLLVTLGSSVLAAGQRVTVLDFTGQRVGDGLRGVAQARGLATRAIELPAHGFDVNLLDGLGERDLAECVAYAVSDPADGRQERALVVETLRRVMACLDGAWSFGRLAAGVDVLRQATPPDGLAAGEVNRLAEQVGELGRDEWTGKQMRFLAAQLRVLDDIAPLEGFAPNDLGTEPLWAASAMSVIATGGGSDDRKELLDRFLVQLAERALRQGRITGVLVIAGADRLGVRTVETISDDARRAGVRLVVMIDQPQGDQEKTLGTGGAVCVMKAYNHRDAAIAADFIGRGYTFVVSQVTLQAGKTFTDGGGDNFSANTGASVNHKSGRRAGTELSDSRGHAWTGVRNWSTADNIGSSRTTSRVYEFTVDPQQILGMPETAFVLVDNSGSARQVVMADCNPGICLLPRVSPTPAPAVGGGR